MFSDLIVLRRSLTKINIHEKIRGAKPRMNIKCLFTLNQKTSLGLKFKCLFYLNFYKIKLRLCKNKNQFDRLDKVAMKVVLFQN